MQDLFDSSEARYAVEKDMAELQRLGEVLADGLHDHVDALSFSPDTPFPSRAVKRVMFHLRYLYHKHLNGVDAADVWKHAVRSAYMPAEYAQAEKEVRAFVLKRNIMRSGNGGGRVFVASGQARARGQPRRGRGRSANSGSVGPPRS